MEAPAGLAAAVTTAALSGTAITTTAVIAATKAIAMTALQKTLITTVLAVAVGTGIYEARHASRSAGSPARDGVVSLQGSPLLKLLKKDMTIHLDNVPLDAVLLTLTTNAGVKIVTDKSVPALTNRLSLKLDKVKLVDFFRYLAQTYDLQFQVGDESVLVVDAKNPKNGSSK